MEKLKFRVIFSSLNLKRGDNFIDDYEGRIILKWILERKLKVWLSFKDIVKNFTGET
jgi:hypothetical protein